MDLRAIRTSTEHQSALDELTTLMMARRGTAEGERLDALVRLVEAYEAAHFPIAPLPEEADVVGTLIDGDDLDDRDRAALRAALDQGEAELDAGLGLTEDELWKRLRAPR